MKQSPLALGGSDLSPSLSPVLLLYILLSFFFFAMPVPTWLRLIFFLFLSEFFLVNRRMAKVEER